MLRTTFSRTPHRRQKRSGGIERSGGWDGWRAVCSPGRTGSGRLCKVRSSERALPATTGLHRQAGGLRAEHCILCLLFLNYDNHQTGSPAPQGKKEKEIWALWAPGMFSAYSWSRLGEDEGSSSSQSLGPQEAMRAPLPSNCPLASTRSRMASHCSPGRVSIGWAQRKKSKCYA